MNKKQKKVLKRIIVAAVLLVIIGIAGSVVSIPKWLEFLFYLVPYFVIGYDILRKAWKGICNRQMFDENFLMAVATVGAIALGDYKEGVAVMLFYQIGELFQSYAVGKSRRNISDLMDIRPDYANIETDGQIEKVDPDEVEIGTVIIVQPGEKVPIDGVVVEGHSSLNTSALTGESVPREVAVGEEIISGCINISGLLKIRTTKEFGESTVSKILDLVENASSKKSRSENFISRFAHYYTPAVCYGALALAILPPLVRMLFMGLPADWGIWIYRALTFLVISCPCALVISIPLSFFAGIGGASREGVLVKGSNYLETLSQTRYVVFDKTGTLTQNLMQVHEAKLDTSKADLIAEGISANSTAFLEEAEAGKKPSGVGNPTEIALLLWLNEQGKNYMELRERATVVNQLTFSTERKYMATLVDSPIQQKRVLYIKGAPEIIMGKCNLSPDAIAQYNADLLAYQNKAMRTLGLAYKYIPEGVGEDCSELVNEGGMTFLGIFAISDPIRPDVPEAVGKCQSAGIGVKIVTGDTPGTATEIARQIGLWKPEDSERNRITGVEFAALSDEEALDRVLDLKVMSRARPMDKQRLVQLLQQKGAVVAVTGDGTNDAPALNHAQVGLSMGTGTSVAKEASDITLLDDSFHSIATAVMWGRSLYKNIQRFIVFQLTINVVALASVLLGAFLGTELPLTVTQMLWVNLIMDTFAAMALASIPPSPDVMNEKPRKTNDFIITKAMRNNILGVGLAFLVILMSLIVGIRQLPASQTEWALTCFFTIFVMLQFWNLFNASVFGTNHSVFKDSRHALGMLSVAVIILIGQIFIVEFGGKVFRTVPLNLTEWIIIITATSLVLVAGEIYRLIKRLQTKKSIR